MLKPETGTLTIRALDPDRAADLALLVREELTAREVELSVSARQDAGLEPETMEASLGGYGDENRSGSAMRFVDRTPEQCLMAILNLLEKNHLLTDDRGYSDRDEDMVNRHLKELGYI